LFLTSPQHDPVVYGYRSVILERHFQSFVADADPRPVHRICASDEEVFTTLTCPSPDDDDDNDDIDDNNGGDFHRRYRPYQRLVAAAHGSSADSSGEGRAAAMEAAASRFAGDDVQLVYRRLCRKSSIGNLTTDTDFY